MLDAVEEFRKFVRRRERFRGDVAAALVIDRQTVDAWVLGTVRFPLASTEPLARALRLTGADIGELTCLAVGLHSGFLAAGLRGWRTGLVDVARNDECGGDAALSSVEDDDGPTAPPVPAKRRRRAGVRRKVGRGKGSSTEHLGFRCVTTPELWEKRKNPSPGK